MPSAKLTLILATLAASVAPFVPAAAEGEIPCADVRGCPDLWVDAARLDPYEQTRTFSETSCAVREGMVQAGERHLLRFRFTTPNSGPGDLIVGAPSQHPEWFVYSSCHNHYHFREYADYRLWTERGRILWETLREAHPDMTASEIFAMYPKMADEMISGHKQGFCVIDIIRYDPTKPAKYRSCGSNQGIAVGWADEYGSGLDGQWIDITNVEPGTYWLEAEVNAERYYRETDYQDNSAWEEITIEGEPLIEPPIELPIDLP